MRFVALIPAVFSLFVSGSAFAQAWDIYSNRENFFSVNLPGDPAQTQEQYKTAKGTTLSARVFTAVAPAGSLLSGKYSVMVIDYANAKDELTDAQENAARYIRAKGKVTYEGANNIDLHLTRRLTVETASSRILAEVLVAANDRLYITQAETAKNVPPPAVFQASLQILDDKGMRIRMRTALGVPEGTKSPIGAGGIPDEPDKVAATMKGSWRVAGGSCDAAYFKSGAMAKTKRGEAAMAGTVVNSGKTINGQLIVNGSREGQFIDPASDQALMLFAPEDGGKLSISAINGEAKGWPDVTLDLCPGSAG
jgi:hypothetical protein